MTDPIDNPFDAMRVAVERAKTLNRAVDEQSEAMALLLVGRMRNASRQWKGAQAVKALKRELADYNVQTGRWKEPKP